MAKHHPHETVLTEYSAGVSQEPVALLMACHMTFCEQCRETVNLLDRVGGSLLEDALEQRDRRPSSTDEFSGTASLEQYDENAVLPQSLLEKLREPVDTHASAPSTDDFPDVIMPRPLRNYVGAPIDKLSWRRITPSLEVIDLLEEKSAYSTRLMRIAAGAAMPRHTHDGDEFTLVLQGGMIDENGSYLRGDVAVGDIVTDHRPMAMEGDDCICLAINESQVRLTGPIGRWLNPFVKF